MRNIDKLFLSPFVKQETFKLLSNEFGVTKIDKNETYVLTEGSGFVLVGTFTIQKEIDINEIDTTVLGPGTWITNLAIQRRFRGNGNGKELLLNAIGIARRRGKKRIFVYCSIPLLWSMFFQVGFKFHSACSCKGEVVKVAVFVFDFF